MSMETFAVCDHCGTKVEFKSKVIGQYLDIPPGWWQVSAQLSALGEPGKDAYRNYDNVYGLCCSRDHAAQYLAKQLA